MVLASLGLTSEASTLKKIADNIKSGYATYYAWDYAINHFDEIIEEAFKNRISKENLADNSRIQMQRNT